MGFVRSRAFWPGVCQVLRAAGLVVCLGLFVFSTEINAQQPAGHPPAPGSVVQTIDIASMSSIVDLDGRWSFHAGDDPRFADPAFDDSDWPTIRSSNQKFATIGVPAVTATYFWTRIHLRIPQIADPLAIALYCQNGDQYEVFANGSRIGTSPGMAARTLWFHPPFPVVLPQSGDIVLAIRFYSGGFNLYSLPFARVSIGSLAAIQTDTKLDRLWAFSDRQLAEYACICVYVLIFLTAMILYRSQRDHDEYLWLGIFALNFALYDLLENALYMSGWLPRTFGLHLLINYTGFVSVVMRMEFVMRFTRIRRRWPIRIVQGAILIPPGLGVSPSTMRIFSVALILLFVAMLAVEAACLISAFRRGMAESGLLLLPLMISGALDVAWATSFAVPAAAAWGYFHFGPVGISGNNLASVSVSLGIMAVVLFRFVRVTRDKERAAAELEAARTVQQILVPEEIPSIPGFSIQAVYQPAGEVGGDFYQVLPAPNGGLLAVIGDVSGKGMPAAMTVSLLVGTVRTLAHYTHDPGEILTAMNQRMLGRSNSGFTTAMVLRVDDDGTLTVANAGHLAPYNNGRELSVENGLPLGLASDVAYKESRLHLAPGDRLTLLSDGVVEARSASGELFGFDRTAAISAKPAEQVAQAARAFGQDDDITVLTVAFAPLAVASA